MTEYANNGTDAYDTACELLNEQTHPCSRCGTEIPRRDAGRVDLGGHPAGVFILCEPCDRKLEQQQAKRTSGLWDAKLGVLCAFATGMALLGTWGSVPMLSTGILAFVFAVMLLLALRGVIKYRTSRSLYI